MSLSAILVIGAAAVTAAQTASPPADPADERDRQWVERRLRFVRDIYALDDAQSAKVAALLNGRLPDQREYQTDPDVVGAERSLRAALQSIDIATQDPAYKPRLREKFQRQMYQWVYVAAPLSYANVLKSVEALLPPEKVASGRKRLQSKLADRLPEGATTVPFDQVDWLVREPVDLPSIAAIRAKLPTLPQSTRQPPARPDAVKPIVDATGIPRPVTPPSRTPVDADTKSVPRSIGTRPQPQQPQQPRPRPVVRPPTPKVVAPAPPIETWSARIETIISGFGYSEAQASKARSIFQQSQKRAAEYRDKNKSSYDAARAITDATGREAKLKTLNQPVDVMYDQLTGRVKSLATIEQQQSSKAVKGADAAKPPAKTPPAKTGGG